MVLLESINPDVVTKVENLLPGIITIQIKDSVTSTNTVLKEEAFVIKRRHGIDLRSGNQLFPFIGPACVFQALQQQQDDHGKHRDDHKNDGARIIMKEF